MLAAGILDDTMSGKVSMREAAEATGISLSTVHRVVSRLRERGRNVASEADAMRDEFFGGADSTADELADAFARWRARFFVDTQGRPFLTKPYHLRWIVALLSAITNGTRMMVLSPPRHGKTSLLAHFCVWLILRNPNVRIMWVGGSLELAQEAVDLVRTTLNDHSELIALFSDNGEGFRPGQNGKWAATQFTVRTRTIVTKSPTMVAVGRAGKILSRDCDVIVVDDIEDQESTDSPTTRKKTRTWTTNTLESRKEDHTAFFVIGSRQHPDDLYGYLLDDPQWDSHVDAAHDPNCGIDPLAYDAHTDCMLMPEIRSYRWLMEKRNAAYVLGNVDHFEMVYLQVPTAEGMAIFTRELCEPARDWSRGLGVPVVDNASIQLVGGLDPAATGYQAAVIWAYDAVEGRIWLVDVDNRRGGGIDEALHTFRWGHETYGVHHWVVEDNGFQRAIRRDRDVIEWANANGVYLEGHVTGSIKTDPNFGVGSISGYFKQGKVNLPYGTPEARLASDTWLQQAYLFTDQPTNRKRLSDVLMASWFPMKVIRRAAQEANAAADIDFEPMFSAYAASSYNEVPW